MNIIIFYYLNLDLQITCDKNFCYFKFIENLNQLLISVTPFSKEQSNKNLKITIFVKDKL